MDVFGSWAATNALGDKWRQVVVPFVLEKVLSNPEDAVVVKFAAKMAGRMGDPECADVVFSEVLRVLQSQSASGDGSSGGSDDGDGGGSGDGGLAKMLLFQRLSPLLLLRTLPLASFVSNALVSRSQPPRVCHNPGVGSSRASVARVMGVAGPKQDKVAGTAAAVTATAAGVPADEIGADAGLEASLATALFERTIRPFEVDNVKKVAAELLSRLRPAVVLPLALSFLEHVST
jgi:hypothetical protein